MLPEYDASHLDKTDYHKKETELMLDTLKQFPYAAQGVFLIGRDEPPGNIMICSGDVFITRVVAYSPGKHGWAINQILLEDGSYVLCPWSGGINEVKYV